MVLKVNRLHEADVCAGEIGLDQARREIAGGSQPRSDRSEYVFNEWTSGCMAWHWINGGGIVGDVFSLSEGGNII
jgi:hypothetical protein